MYNWIKRRWSDPVWSKVFANLIWVGLTSLGILVYTILKKWTLNLSFKDAWTKTIEFLSSKQEVSILWLFIIIIFLVFFIINVDFLKRFLIRLVNRYRVKEEFVFQKQLNDDHYYPIPLVTPKTKYRLEIKPTDSPYWRFGFTLSQNGTIDKSQRQKRQPLFHLTKNLNINQLYATEYDDNFKLVTNDLLLIDNYIDQQVTVIIYYEEKTSSTFIIVKDANKRELIRRSYQSFQYLILSTWGDGNDYKISMTKNTYY